MKPSAPSSTRITHAQSSALGFMQAENIVERSPAQCWRLPFIHLCCCSHRLAARKTITQHQSSRTSMQHARCLRRNRAQSQSAVARNIPKWKAEENFLPFSPQSVRNRSVLMFGERKVGTFPCFRVQKFSAVYLRGVFSGCRSQSVGLGSHSLALWFQRNF